MREMRLLCLVVASLTTVLRHVQADYIVMVKTEAYNNPTSHCYGCVANGFSQPGCCDDFFATSCNANLRCDTYFNYCLLPSARTPNPDTRTTSSGCTGGLTSQTNEDDANINYLSPTVLGLPNPFNLTGTTEQWMGVQLFIEAWDQDASGNPHDLIDQFVIEITSAPAPMNITSTMYSGIRGFSQLSLTLQLLCVNGYTGDRCDIVAEDCTNINCSGLGTCSGSADNYRCVCPPGYTGEHCETDVDECMNIDCSGNGHCIDGINAYTCNCTSGYTGEHCEMNTIICEPAQGCESDEQGTHPCANFNNCSGNGQCVLNENGSYNCRCFTGYEGSMCLRTTVTDLEIDGEPNTTMLATIIGGTLGGLLVLMILLLVVGIAILTLVWRESKRSNATENATPSSVELDEVIYEEIEALEDNALYNAVPFHSNKSGRWNVSPGRANVLDYQFETPVSEERYLRR